MFFDQLGIAYLRAANIQWSGVDISDVKQMWFSPRDVSQLALEDGDLLVSEGGDVGRSCIWKGEIPNCHFQNSVNRVRSKGAALTRFLYYWIQSIKGQGYIDVVCNKSTIAHFTAEKVEVVPFPVPTPDEQKSIVSFLDHETAKIDALIHEQKRLIALLNEERTAAVADLILGGNQPKRKGSGVDWIGSIPKHWSTTRICYLFRESTELGGADLPVLSVSIHNGVSDKELDDDELDRKVTRSEDRGKYKRVRAGDLVYNMMRAWQGGFGTVLVDGLVSPAYVVARPTTELKTRYVELLLRTGNAIAEMKSRSRGVTDFRLRLYWEEFKDVRVPIPPLEEQIEILRQVEMIDKRVDALEAEALKLIDLLAERRSSLISSAVTGKIDVRGLA